MAVNTSHDQNKGSEARALTKPYISASLVLFLSLLLCLYRPIPFPGSFRQASTHPQRDTCWAETVVHPVLLWHPFPRRIVIAGDGTDHSVKEALRHIATTPVHWIDSVSPDIAKDVDILSRVLRYPGRDLSIDHFFATQNFTFDVVILDRTPSSSLVITASEALAPGGILAFGLPDIWDNSLSQALVTFKHVHLFIPLDSAGKSQYFAVMTNSDAYPPPSHLSPTFVDTHLGRRVINKSSLQHYDGETHLRMFLLERQVRNQLREIYSTNRNAATKPFDPNLAPYDRRESSVDAAFPKTTTFSRDFVLCERPPLNEVATKQIVHESLSRGAAILIHFVSHTWSMYQNVSTHLEFAPPTSNIPAQIIAMAIFDGGSLSFHALPRLGTSRAVLVNSNTWVSSDDILDNFVEAQRCDRESGVRHSGPAPLIPSSTLDERISHFGDEGVGSIGDWRLQYPFWVSPKIDVRRSVVDGSGIWANADILRDEVVLDGPVEVELLHIQEYERYPQWKKDLIDHFGESPHEELHVVPSMGLEAAMFYTNHACNPNLKYLDSYDVMVATRNISSGEEITFDYATSCVHDFSFDCNCGAENCRHKITNTDWQNKELVQHLGKEAFLPSLKAKILHLEMTQT